MASDNENIVDLHIQDVTIKFSKERLISSSDYFKALFSSNFIESKKSSFEIHDVDPEAMKIILHFIESGVLSCIGNKHQCFSVLQCASMLQFCNVQKMCEDYLFQEITYENAFEIYQTCHRLGISDIAEAALTCALWECEYVFDTPYYLNLSVEDVVKFLSIPEINISIKGEWLIWEGISKWIYHDEPGRNCYLLKLLKCIDYSVLSSDDFTNIMFYDLIGSSMQATIFLGKIKAVFTKSQQCEDPNILDGMSNDIIVEMNDALNDVFNRERAIKRCLASMAWMATLSVIHNENGTETFRPIVCWFDVNSNKVEELFPLSKMSPKGEACVGFRVCSIGPVFYITGGQYNHIGSSTWNDDVWSYCSITRKWMVHPPLPRKRRNHSTCVLGSVIYLMGGYGQYRVTANTMDAYDTKAGEWLKNLPDFPHYENGAVCAFKNRMLVFLNSEILAYYPESRLWTTARITSEITNGFSAAVSYGNAVFLLGNYSNDIFRIYPDNDNNVIEFYGSFKNYTANVCLSPPNLLSFTVEADLQKKDQELNVVEVMNIEEQEEIYPMDKKKKINLIKEGKDNSNCDATVIWTSSTSDIKSCVYFTSFSNASATSNGCSEFFKLERGRLE